jgi:hypothetical protein
VTPSQESERIDRQAIHRTGIIRSLRMYLAGWWIFPVYKGPPE